MILLILLFTLTLSMVILSLSGARLQEKAGDRFTEYSIVLFFGLWFVAAKDFGAVPAWMPFLMIGLFVGLLVASTIMALKPPKVPAWEGEQRFARHDVEAIVVDTAVWITMFLFGISVLGRFQW